MPRVSVIIPTYNREEFITETINSVLNQTYKDFEIIVVDDGSTDNTKLKLESFKSNIKLIEQKNSERAIATNNGVKNSSGEYIAFLDSDDIWIKDKLEKQVKLLDSNSDVVLTYGQCLRINEYGEEIQSAKRQLQGFSGDVFTNLLMRNFISSPTPMIRREYLETTRGFQTKYIPYEDWEFWIRFSLLGKFSFSGEPFAYYRIHKNQSVKLVQAEKIETVTSLLLEDSFKLKNDFENIKKHSLGLANLRFCYWYILANQNKKAKEKLKKAINLSPKIFFDPRWHGLNLISAVPSLMNMSIGVFDLEQYH